jgi:hypothetical protein
MRMSVGNLNAVRDWAIRNQAALPDVTLRLVFATDLAKSVIEQESAPDPQRVIEIGYDIANLMWRARVAAGVSRADQVTGGGKYAAGTRLILHVLRQGKTATADVVEFIEGKSRGTTRASTCPSSVSGISRSPGTARLICSPTSARIPAGPRR